MADETEQDKVAASVEGRLFEEELNVLTELLRDADEETIANLFSGAEEFIAAYRRDRVRLN